MRQWLHSAMRVPKGGSVLDIGCGGGEDLLLMARGMPQVASFVGVDSRSAVIDSATELARQDQRLTFTCASADERLPFDDCSFDAVYSVNALECIKDKDGFARECRRLLKPGGQLVVAHWDWDTQTFDGADRVLTRKVVHAFNDWKQAWMDDIDPWMGRRLWKVFHGSRLFEGNMHAYTLTNTRFAEGGYGWQQAQNFGALVKRGLISEDEYRQFLAEQQALEAEGTFFFSLTLYAYVGAATHR